MKLTIPQWQIASDESRFRVLIAGRRFGKTFLATRELAKFAAPVDQKVFYIAPSYRQAKQIIWEPLKNKLSDLNWLVKANESDLTCHLVNGSVIGLRSADNFDSMRGVGLDFAVFDEFADMDSRTWTEVIRPALSDRGGHAMFIGTPKGKSNWSYDLAMKARDLQDWRFHTFTTAQGGQVPPEELEAAKLDLDIRTYRQEYEATFESYEGVVYYGFTDANIQAYQGDVPRHILVWVDFNVSPMSAAIAVATPQGYHIVDEVVIYNSNTQELIDEITTRYGSKRVTAFPDPAGTQRKTSAGGLTDIKILQNAGWEVKHRRNHPTIKDRVNAVNSALQPIKGQPKVLVDPRCRKSIESFRKMTYKEGTTVPDKSSGWDHMTDAIGYGIEYLLPIKKNPDEDSDLAYNGYAFS